MNDELTPVLFAGITFAYVGGVAFDIWADAKSNGRLGSSLLSVLAVIVIGTALYGAVFAPHLATKLGGWVTAGTTAELFPGVPNQPP